MRPKPLPSVRPPRTVDDYVYVAQCEANGCLKIGNSCDVPTRLQALRSDPMAKGPLRLVAWWRVKSSGTRWTPPFRGEWSARLAEIDLHARFHRWLICGEWFQGKSAAVALVARLRRGAIKRPPQLVLHELRWLGNGERRRWLECYYDALAKGGSWRRALKAVQKFAADKRNLASLKSQITALRNANKRLRAHHFVGAA